MDVVQRKQKLAKAAKEEMQVQHVLFGARTNLTV
jgi:hypothetical protein